MFNIISNQGKANNIYKDMLLQFTEMIKLKNKILDSTNAREESLIILVQIQNVTDILENNLVFGILIILKLYLLYDPEIPRFLFI